MLKEKKSFTFPNLCLSDSPALLNAETMSDRKSPMKMPMSTSRLYEMTLHCLNQPVGGDTARQSKGSDLTSRNRSHFYTTVRIVV